MLSPSTQTCQTSVRCSSRSQYWWLQLIHQLFMTGVVIQSCAAQARSHHQKHSRAMQHSQFVAQMLRSSFPNSTCSITKMQVVPLAVQSCRFLLTISTFACDLQEANAQMMQLSQQLFFCPSGTELLDYTLASLLKASRAETAVQL